MELAFRKYGEGPSLLILHGLFGQMDNWNSLAKQFASLGFTAITIDQRNHGLSPHSYEWTYELMAHDLMEFIEHHNLQSPIILGHSMGGKTLMFFEKLFPKIAQKLIICDIAARAYEPKHNEVVAALNAVDFNHVKTRKDAELVLNSFIKDFGTKQFLLKNIYWKDTDANLMDWRFNLKAITDNYNNVSVAVPEFISNSPTLIIRGSLSDYINEEDIQNFNLRFNNITIETILDAGHWVHAEKPLDFFECVKRFIVN
ncbi:MAG: alpha/beta fold hydrolase [Bacteroidetes bacterium]|nr:alpha/beta fold hydrolase [Bacteroidota bacterium]MCA6442430.1 alpha/beta fold hydrolase [Bacteroidota bacterium]